MKNFGKLAVLGAVLAASSSFAFAGTYTLGSFGDPGISGYAPSVVVANTEMLLNADQLFTTDTVGCGANPFCLPPMTSLTSVVTNAVDLNPDGVWHLPLTNSSWVGINKFAGPEQTSNPQYGYYDFYTSFNAVGGVYGGTMSILADDTTAVYLNGALIVNYGTLGKNVHCADTAPTCLDPDPVSLNVTLASGFNQLDFIVMQTGTGPFGGTSDPSGVDFAATLTQTPEPNSLMLLGTGLMGAAGMLFRRRVTA